MRDIINIEGLNAKYDIDCSRIMNTMKPQTVDALRLLLNKESNKKITLLERGMRLWQFVQRLVAGDSRYQHYQYTEADCHAIIEKFIVQDTWRGFAMERQGVKLFNELVEPLGFTTFINAKFDEAFAVDFAIVPLDMSKVSIGIQVKPQSYLNPSTQGQVDQKTKDKKAQLEFKRVYGADTIDLIYDGRTQTFTNLDIVKKKVMDIIEGKATAKKLDHAAFIAELNAEAVQRKQQARA